MAEQYCMTCGASFDYVKNVATVICKNSHVVCVHCAKQLAKTNSKCPHCLAPITYNNQPKQFLSDDDQSQHYHPQNRRPQPPPQQRRPPQPYPPTQNNYQPRYRAPNPPALQHPNQNMVQGNIVMGMPVQNQGKMRAIGTALCLASTCLIICIYFVVQMNTCSWYDRWSCYYPDPNQVLCCSDFCPSMWWYCETPFQLGRVALPILYAVVVLAGSVILAAFIALCREKAVQKRSLLQRNNSVHAYARV